MVSRHWNRSLTKEQLQQIAENARCHVAYASRGKAAIAPIVFCHKILDKHALSTPLLDMVYVVEAGPRDEFLGPLAPLFGERSLDARRD